VVIGTDSGRSQSVRGLEVPIPCLFRLVDGSWNFPAAGEGANPKYWSSFPDPPGTEQHSPPVTLIACGRPVGRSSSGAFFDQRWCNARCFVSRRYRLEWDQAPFQMRNGADQATKPELAPRRLEDS
jgi:hypothetical protein